MPLEEVVLTCAECGSSTYVSDTVQKHSLGCSQISFEELQRKAINYKRGYEEANRRMAANSQACSKRVQKAKEETTLWQGKYLIVVQENNTLRKKIKQ